MPQPLSSSIITKRRAAFVYDAARLAAAIADAPIVPVSWAEWEAKKVHPDMVPYAQLGKLEQDKDGVFVALCEIARQWIYDQ